jgi:LacI family transcriptional regulator
MGMQAERRRRAVKAHLLSNSATVSDVARLADVSTATVSRALNTPDIVRPEVRQRVAVAVEKLGYIPNVSAKALRLNQTRLIGVVIPTLNFALYADFFAALQEKLGHAGYFALLTTSDYDLGREAEQAAKLIRQGAQGLVLVGRLHDSKLVSMMATLRIPYVNTYVHDPIDASHTIGFDNARAIGDVVDYLAALGHRRIAMLSGPTANSNDRAMARVHGFVWAVTHHRLACRDWVAEAPYTIEGGRSAICEIFRRGLEPTAIVCGSDMLAVGALQECKARGLRVPADLSIVGFDNLEFVAHLDPSLTTVAVPSVELGRAAADHIAGLCSGVAAQHPAALETHLVVRKSTAAPPDRRAGKR